MFGLPTFLIQPIIWVVVAAVLAFGAHKAWQGFTSGYVEQGSKAQIAKDQPVIDAANAKTAEAEQRATNAQTDTAACVAAAGTQSAAIAAANKRAKDAQEATKAIIEAAKRDAAVKQQRIGELQRFAAAPPVKDMACADELGKAKAILQESLRARRPAVPGAK